MAFVTEKYLGPQTERLKALQSLGKRPFSDIANPQNSDVVASSVGRLKQCEIGDGFLGFGR